MQTLKGREQSGSIGVEPCRGAGRVNRMARSGVQIPLIPSPLPVQVNTAWEGFTTQLQQFDAHLEEQKGQLAVAISKQLEDFR